MRKIIFILVALLFTYSVFGCDEKALMSCLQDKGGVTCFSKHACSQEKYQSAYCHHFDLEICLKYEGGKACVYNLDDCKYILEKEKKQNQIVEQTAPTTEKTVLPINKPCPTQKVKTCLKHKGGEECFKKYSCEPSSYQASICKSFNFQKCLRNKGGEGCYKTRNECHSRTSSFASTSTTSTPSSECDSEKVIQCEKKGGGADCFTQFNCTALSYQKNYCQNFDVDRCGQYQGGVSCKQIKKNCLLFLSKIEEQPKQEILNKPAEAKQQVEVSSNQNEPTLTIIPKVESSNIQQPITDSTPVVSTPQTISKDYCAKFSYQTCQSFGGGEACQKNKQACETQGFETADIIKLKAQQVANCRTQTAPNPSINALDQAATQISKSASDKVIEEEMMAKLKKYGHKVFPINELSIIVKKGSYINYSDLKSHNCSALLSGTFYGRPYNPVGPFISNNEITIPDSKTVNRGYIAVMSDGSVSVSSMNDPNYNYHDATDRQNARSLFNSHINKIEADRGAKMVQMLGGGALLVRNSKPVSINDLTSRQSFDQGIGNLTAAQMRQTNHTVAFIHNGHPYVMMTSSVSGKTLQSDLLEARVESAVKFDGGSGCAVYVKDRSQNICPSQGVNPSGMCVK